MKRFIVIIVLLLFIPAIFASVDPDMDGVPDSEDQCPGSKPDFRPLDVGKYAQNDVDSAFESGPQNINSEYTMDTTNGCTCLQIAEQLGIDKNLVVNGCSLNMMQAFVEGPSASSTPTGAVAYRAPSRGSSGLTGMPLLAVIAVGLYILNNFLRRKK